MNKDIHNRSNTKSLHKFAVTCSDFKDLSEIKTKSDHLIMLNNLLRFNKELSLDVVSQSELHEQSRRAKLVNTKPKNSKQRACDKAGVK